MYDKPFSWRSGLKLHFENGVKDLIPHEKRKHSYKLKEGYIYVFIKCIYRSIIYVKYDFKRVDLCLIIGFD